MSEFDPILIKREKITKIVKFGLKSGYGIYGLSCLLLVFRMMNGYSDFIETSIMICLILGSILLAPAIVFNYAIKAAHRADRENSW